MANYSQLKAAIDAVIKTNGNQEITGAVLQTVLDNIVNVIGANYTFAGVATPSTNPGTPDQNVVYMASEKGTYTNFGGIEVPIGISLLKFKGTWSIDVIINFNSSETPFVRKNIMVYSGETRENYLNACTNIQARGQNEILDPLVIKKIGYDYQLTESIIEDNQWIANAGGNTAVCYFKLVKGKTILLRFNNTSTYNYGVVGYWLTSKPQFGVTDFTDTQVITCQNTNNGLYKYVEFTAPENGYLVIRHSLVSGLTLVAAVWEDFTNVNSYEKEWLGYYPLKVGKGIDCLEDSETYGQEIDLAASTTSTGCTDYIDISGFAYIQLRSFQAYSSSIKNIQVGSVFYDSNKQPIETVVSCNFVATPVGGSYLHIVPSGAKYIRITEYDSTSGRADGIKQTGRMYGYKNTIPTYNRLQEAKIESIESIFQKNVKTKTVTLIPSERTDEVFNAYSNLSTDAHKLIASKTRLAYCPNVYTIGGTILNVNYTGAHGKHLRILQFSFIPLNNDWFVDGAGILKSDWFPANSYDTYTGIASVVLDKNCKRVVMIVTSGDNTEITPFDVNDYITSVQLEQQDGYIETTDDSDTSRVEQLVRQSQYVSDGATVEALSLIHCTDIHEDDGAIADILQFHSNGMTHEILFTGDLPYSVPANTKYHSDGVIAWMQEAGFMKKMLFTLGNHDGATSNSTIYDQKEGNAAWDGEGKEFDYQNYFAPYITDAGYVMPDGYDDSSSPNYHACYWHKDYAASKIRLIGVDCIHRFDGVLNPETGAIIEAGLKHLTNEQELWLIEKLNETIDSNNAAYGYSVIIACHYPMDDVSGANEQWNEDSHKFIYNQNENGGIVMSYKNNAPVNFQQENISVITSDLVFNMRNRVDDGYRQGVPYPNYTKGSTNNMAEIIKYWIAQGGKFIAWLSGHRHRDFMYYPTEYPDMLVITCDQAGTLNAAMDRAHTGIRNPKYNDAYAYNIVTVDVQNGLIKLVRNGYDTNHLLNSHQYICYDYINKKVLNEG